MSREKILGLILMVVAALATFASDASNVWWVDDDNCGKTGMDGRTATTAFGTVQEAIDNQACLAGDIIKVLPGTYDQGCVESRNADGDVVERNRIVIGKKLNIVAVGTKEETHIVGRHCPVSEGGDADYETGPTAVRCVRVAESGLGSMLSGFTIRDSATIDSAVSSAEDCGGSVAVEAASKFFFVTDCVISNTACRRYGGASYGGTFIRCLISNSRASTYGSAFSSSDAIFSVLSHCRLVNETASQYCTLDNGNGRIVNCTIYGGSSVRPSSGGCYYCVFVGNKRSETNGVSEESNVYASHGSAYRNAGPVQLFAPALGDFHPLPDSDVFGAGETRYLTTECPILLPEGFELLDMDGKQVDVSGEHVAAGAYQNPKAPKYGGVLLTANSTINGFPTYGTNQFFASRWPMQVKVKSSLYMNVSGYSDTSELSTRWPGRDEYVTITPPYATGLVQTNAEYGGSNTYYVDAVNGDDNTTNSSQVPFATLQKAIDKYSSSGKLAKIFLAEGDYCVGGAVGRGVTNRVNITGPRWFKIIATGDRSKTIIRGSAAKNERDPVNYPGCGPDAVRCVNFSYNNANYNHTVAFVGVTFADGHTDAGQSADNDMGGGAYGRPNGCGMLQFIDCVFTNCYAPAAGVGAQAHFIRCKFVDCKGPTDGFRETMLSSSLVEGGDFGTGALGKNTRAVGCTITSANAVADDASGLFVLNSIVSEGTKFPASAAIWGTTAYPCFADSANGDYRPVSGSPALDAARRSFPKPEESGWDDFQKYISYLSVDGIDANMWIYSGAYPIAGAYMDWVQGVSIHGQGTQWLTVTGASLGGNQLQPGSKVTIARKSDAVRHWGVVVDGVTNFLDSGSVEYIVGEGMNDGSITAVLDQNWYVNPDQSAGSDDNNGFTADTPKLTLKGVLSVATNSGDVVNAASGVYDSGEMLPIADAEGRTYRAVLPTNVTLKAVGCAADTAIVGSDSARGVFFSEGSGLIGFTVRDCKVRDNKGGAALVGSQDDRRTVVADCIVSNCESEVHSAGAYYIRHVFRTRFHGCTRPKTANNGNDSQANGSTARGGIYYNCLFDGNGGKYEVYLQNGMKNCTFGSEGSSTVRQTGEPIWNTLMLRSPRERLELYNCYMSTTNTMNSGGYTSTLDERCVVTNAEFLALDANYAPVIGSNISIDMGDWNAYTNGWPLALDPKGPEFDLYGNPRVKNGRMDIGAVEADWCQEYASTLGGGRGFAVVSASSNVTNANGFVALPDGGELTASWHVPAGMMVGSLFSFRNTGSGTFYVTVNGETVAYGPSEKTQIVRFCCTSAADSVSLKYEAGEDGKGCAEIFGFAGYRGLRLTIR